MKRLWSLMICCLALSCVQGPAGPAGETGSRGPAGQVGPMGPRGFAGASPVLSVQTQTNGDGVELMFYADGAPLLDEWLFIPTPDPVVDTVYVSSRDTVCVEYRDYVAEVDSGGLRCFYLASNAFLFRWTHHFHSVVGDWEKALKYNIGADWFSTRDAMLRWSANEAAVAPDTSIWYGQSYGQTTRAEFLSGRMHWEYLMTNVPVNMYGVVSCQAVDAAGNRSEWYRSTRAPEPFYLLWLPGRYTLSPR